MTANPMTDGRRADSARRRERVMAALHAARSRQTEVSVSAIARAASVDRTFLYRHRDLLDQVHRIQAQLLNAPGPAPVSHPSLQADLANAHGQITRQALHIRRLEERLSHVLGDQAWREAGIGAPADIEALHQRITQLEQQLIGLRETLAERDQEIEAARAANRELITNLNRPGHKRHS